MYFGHNHLIGWKLEISAQSKPHGASRLPFSNRSPSGVGPSKLIVLVLKFLISEQVDGRQGGRKEVEAIQWELSMF